MARIPGFRDRSSFLVGFLLARHTPKNKKTKKRTRIPVCCPSSFPFETRQTRVVPAKKEKNNERPRTRGHCPSAFPSASSRGAAGPDRGRGVLRLLQQDQQRRAVPPREGLARALLRDWRRNPFVRVGFLFGPKESETKAKASAFWGQQKWLQQTKVQRGLKREGNRKGVCFLERGRGTNRVKGNMFVGETKRYRSLPKPSWSHGFPKSWLQWSSHVPKLEEINGEPFQTWTRWTKLRKGSGQMSLEPA